MHQSFLTVRVFLLTLIGFGCCIAHFVFLILCIPVFILRFILIFVAKFIRPDLASILDGYSALHLTDYFSNKNTSRSNVLSTFYYEGNLSTEELKSIVLQRWIHARRDSGNGPLIYGKFQQYPVSWMGFGFWRKCSETFSIDNHVHTLYGKDLEVNEDQLNDACEKLLNSPLPRCQSPWEIYVVENLTIQNITASALILKIHHVLMDGHSQMSAMVKGLYQVDLGLGHQNVPRLLPHQQSFCQKLKYALTLPLTFVPELSYILSHNLRNSSWKIPDHGKSWHQIFVKTGPIQIETIKRIKNYFEVGFTSVLLSAISAAITKLESDIRIKGGNNLIKNYDDCILCASTVTIMKGRNTKALTNNVGAVLLALPKRVFGRPEDRLKKVEENFRRVKSAVITHAVTNFYPTLLGLLFHKPAGYLSKNRMVPITLVNFPGLAKKVDFNGQKEIDGEFIMGSYHGDGGFVVTVFSHDEHFRIGITTDTGFMSRCELNMFCKYILDEIQLLINLVDC